MNQYIDLNRSFASIPKNLEFNEEINEIATDLGLGLTEKKKWDHLLELYRVIILAEAGSGKTWEIREITNRLRNKNKRAFFFRLEFLCSNFDTSFEKGNKAEFEEWLILDEPAWFFLDSVDEARLENPKNFEAAIRNFGIKLGDNKQRAHIYITSRISEWRPQSDLMLVKRHLPLIKTTSSNNEETENTPFDLDSKSSSRKSILKKDDKLLLEPEVFTLLPLDKNQIKIFSQAEGVIDINSFLDAIEKAEADIFSKRPLDLVDLIFYWKKYGEIANRFKLIEFNIKSKLKEIDQDRNTMLPLSLRDASWGAEMTAAAVTFQKKERILVPDKNHEQALENESIDVSKVLIKWSSDSLRALLQRPIFDNAIYGTLRFHHRSIREFLTAKWLNELLRKGKSPKAIESLFFKNLYGREILVPSMRPILAWLIVFNGTFWDKAMNIAPEVFIQGGDPSSLPKDIRKNLLIRFCELYTEQPGTDFSFDLSEVRRFAHPDLEDTVKGLLNKYSGYVGILDLLLRMVWQGEMKGCSDEVLAVFLEDNADVYSRIYATRSIAAIGSDSQQKQLIDSVLTGINLKDEYLIGELIKNFVPDKLTIRQALSLIERVEESEHYHTMVESYLKDTCLNNCTPDDIIEWLKGFLVLIKREPVIERPYYEVSQKYGWLLPISSLLSERLIKSKHEDALNPIVLETICLSQVERRYGHFRREEHFLDKLVPEWPELNRKLFWFDVMTARKYRDKKKKTRLTRWQQVGYSDHFWNFQSNDFDTIIKEIQTKQDIDDKLVALSLAFELYKKGGRGITRLNKLKKVVNGISELEETLNGFLHPPKMSEEDKRFRRQEAKYKRRRIKREKEEADRKQKWFEWLQNNFHVLRDASIAPEGQVWNASIYLEDILRKKREDRNSLAVANWEDLIPEFGRDVAEAFRDGCIEYWRKYKPKIRLDGPLSHKIPYAVTTGLSGLKMESLQVPNWPKNLTEQEAHLACKYAINELNGFPDWLRKLHSVFPDIVEQNILEEIEWEFSEYDSEEICHYVLSDIFWQLDWIKPRISDRILSLLDKYDPKHDATLKNALGIVLNSPILNKEKFIAIAREKSKNTFPDNQRAIWLAGWICVEANEAIKVLENTLSQIADSLRATNLFIRFILTLLGDRVEPTISRYNDYLKPEILVSLIKLSHTYISREEDIIRKGGRSYSPSPRDHAQDNRRKLFDLLLDIPGKATYLALMDLSQNHPDEAIRKACLVHAKRRAEADSEFERWNPEAIAIFSEEAEKPPQNHRELFELAISRLINLKADLEDGDSSNAELLMNTKEERLHRIYIGGWLRDRGIGKYNVTPEEELADKKKPDLRLHGISFDGPVPMELKIADNWSAPDLFERFHNQLCGQYLRDVRSNNGIYLIVRCKKTKWRHPNSKEWVNFNTLIQLLKKEAEKIVAKDRKIEAIEIVTIDLMYRNTNR